MNTEWKKGYEEGFAAGFKAGKNESQFSYTNYPPVYYGGTPTGLYSSTMADTGGYSYGDTKSTLNETKTEKMIRNLTDHTLIV